MFGPDQVEMEELKTPNGWFLCVQLDDLQKVCEWLYLNSRVRYRQDLFPLEPRLPFLVKDNPTEDRQMRVLHVVEFEQAQQVVSYNDALRPKGFRWKRRPDELPDWIWHNRPWPHVDESGFRQVCLNNAFFCAFKEDQPFIDSWMKLIARDRTIRFAEGYHETPMPFLITVTVSRTSPEATLTAVPCEDLLVLVRRWGFYLGARNMPPGEWENKYAPRIDTFFGNLVHARWPIHRSAKVSEPSDRLLFG